MSARKVAVPPPEDLTDQVWEEMLDAQICAAYWHRKANRYQRWNLALRIAGAIATPAVAGAWFAGISSVSWVVTVAGTSVAILNATLELPMKVHGMAFVEGLWTDVGTKLELLWLHRESKSETQVRAELGVLMTYGGQATNHERGLPENDQALAIEVGEEVLRRHGVRRTDSP
jgi:hypothetical protein